jgi:hypothetical protein
LCFTSNSHAVLESKMQRPYRCLRRHQKTYRRISFVNLVIPYQIGGPRAGVFTTVVSRFLQNPRRADPFL